MMNKGSKSSKPRNLFGLSADEIDVLVHPQSIVHGMVEFSDRSVVAQLGAPDMRIPIAHCLGWPDRIVWSVGEAGSGQDRVVDVRGPDFERFPGLRLAYDRPSGPAAARPRFFNAPTRLRWLLSSPPDQIRGHRTPRRSHHERLDSLRKSRALTSADDAIAFDHNARNKAASLLPQIALKAS